MISDVSVCKKRRTFGAGTLWARCWILGPVCALVIGVFALSARSGLLEARAARADDTYYNLLVRALRAGQLNLLMEVPPGFAQLADPYDPVANERYRLLEDHPLHDLSYYKGKLYLYFGITPALVLFWPYTALTGQWLLHKDAVVIFFAVGFLASVGLLCAMWRRYFAEVGVGVVAAGALALGLTTLTPVILPRCDVYEVSISCGYALTMLALAGVWAALHQPQRRGRWLAAASLAYGLAVGTRPSLLFGAVILLVPVVQVWREHRPVWAPLLAATGPIALIGLVLMLYNTLRFDNPLEFGVQYHLSGYRRDMGQHFSLRYLWFNFRVFFLEPARWSGSFPFVQDIAVPPAPAGYVEVEHPFGVLTNVPLVWLALAVPLAWRERPPGPRSLLRGFLGAVALLFGICALTICLYNWSCLRYQADFVSALVLLAVTGILGLERALAGQRTWRLAARLGWGLLLVYSVAFNLLASLDHRAEADARLGVILAEKGQLDEAIRQFQEAIRLKPDYANARFNFSAVLSMNGQTDEAIRQYEEALRLKPDEAEAQYNLATLLLGKGRLDEAIHHFQQALSAKRDYAEAHNNLGTAFYRQGRVGEAIREFQEALRLKPDFADARKNLFVALAARAEAPPPAGTATNR